MHFQPVLITAVVFAAYLLIRHPYRRLPLHIDTGFYVSNHLIVNRRLGFSQGWNATFAGGSKVLTELFYSLCYLRHGGAGYASKARLYFSLYNFAAAVAVGLLAYTLFGGNLVYYYAGLIVYALLSSEPHWGGYDECGEQFEVLPQVLAVVCLCVGLGEGSWWLCSLAAFLWAAETCFIKLSSVAGFVVLFGATAWSQPWTILPILGGAAPAGLAYFVWLTRMGKNPAHMIASLWGHEVSYGRRFDLRALTHRGREKVARFGDTLRRQPIIPLLIVYGLIAGDGPPPLLWWYLAAVAVAYLVQAADVRYYLIPFWPPLAVLGAQGALALLGASTTAYVLLGAAALAWLAHNTVRAYLADTSALNRWAWAGMLEADARDRNLTLTRCGAELRSMCRGKSLFVYGPYNQAYVLAEASYSTPIVTAGDWLDAMAPDWQHQLCARLVESPPDFVLDTDRCFAAAAVRADLGLDYELAHVFTDHLRLYALRAQNTEGARPEQCLSYAPQPREHLAAEQARSTRLDRDLPREPASRDDDADASAARRVLQELADAGCSRIGIYGAGRNTVALLDVLEESPVEIAAVLDDDTGRHGQSLSRWTICPLSDAADLGLDAILVCSKRFERPMVQRCRRYQRRGIVVVGLHRRGPIEPGRPKQPTDRPVPTGCPDA